LKTPLRIGSVDYKRHIDRNSHKFTMSENELRELLKAWFVISLAFAIVLGGLGNIVGSFLVASLSVGLGFIFHELGHKIAAQRYGCHAEFQANNQMLVFALVTSLFGIVFAAPGAVMIYGHIDKRQNGIISLAGPAVNFVIAVLFLLLLPHVSGVLTVVATYGYLINSWLGLFNLIPILNLDGKKVLMWNKAVYIVMLMIGFLVMNLRDIFQLVTT